VVPKLERVPEDNIREIMCAKGNEGGLVPTSKVWIAIASRYDAVPLPTEPGEKSLVPQ
jgi:hypothetical protein